MKLEAWAVGDHRWFKRSTRKKRPVTRNDDNNNNNLQLGYRPVAVVILHVHKYGKKVTRKFNLGGLHERHVVAAWKHGNRLSIRL